MRVHNPSAPARAVAVQQPHRLIELSGKVVGFIDNAKPNFSDLADDIAEQLTRHYGVASTMRYRKRGPSIPAADEVIADFSEQCDLVITGSGD
jgi:hypothetical protein